MTPTGRWRHTALRVGLFRRRTVLVLQREFRYRGIEMVGPSAEPYTAIVWRNARVEDLPMIPLEVKNP